MAYSVKEKRNLFCMCFSRYEFSENVCTRKEDACNDIMTWHDYGRKYFIIKKKSR